MSLHVATCSYNKIFFEKDITLKVRKETSYVILTRIETIFAYSCFRMWRHYLSVKVVLFVVLR